MPAALETLKTFDINSLPDLDTVVAGALELIAETELPYIPEFQRPLVIGSAGAFHIGQILYSDSNAVFANESNFEKQLQIQGHIDGVVMVSASGGKHAVGVVKHLVELGKDVVLITNNPGAPAASLLPDDRVVVFPKNREPYTYNTSTYFSMVFAKTREDAGAVKAFLDEKIKAVLLKDLAVYSAYTFIVPPEFGHVRAMLRIKFDELFGPKLTGRMFTTEEIKHAKTVVGSGDELFVSVGVPNEHFGLPKNRLQIPLPENAKYGAVLAACYSFVGQIQKANPPFFKDAIDTYAKEASELFGQSITAIVE